MAISFEKKLIAIILEKMLKEYVKFYYGALTEQKQKIYKILYDGFKSRQESINVNVNILTISISELHDIITSVYNDTPSFYYLKITSISIRTSILGYTIYPEYLYSDVQIKEFDIKLENGLKLFCNKYISPYMSDYQKEKIIHDFLVKTVEYDHDAADSPVPQINEAYNVLGALLKRKAVCWGIACAFKLMCDYCNVKCFVVTGDIKPKTEDAGHAWNIVKLENDSYHVDVTWDIKEKGDISFCYDYLNLDDNLIQLNHTWTSELYPKCISNKYNYYYMNRLYVKSLEDLYKYVTQKLNSGERYIAVKYANELPPLCEIDSIIRNSIQNSNVYGSGSYYISEQTHNIYIEIVQ